MLKTYPIPASTYRLQFNKEFTLVQASEIADYLQQLGISHCYASPLLQAKPGSSHGYDIVDHTQINREIGSLDELRVFAHLLKSKEMGIVLDIVPNHMHIVDQANKWWQDVLENGPSSSFAHYFDIDWHPLRSSFENKVLLPLLEQQYGSAIESQSIGVAYDNGRFLINLKGFMLPTDPKSWIIILDSFAAHVLRQYDEESHEVRELQSIITALKHLPKVTEKENERITERMREKEIIKKRLAELLIEPQTREMLQQVLNKIAGSKGDPHSFDQLEAFLNEQPYRLCFWRIANDEINFRRFFDIFEYAGIRTECEEVFTATHKFIFELLGLQYISGLRIDHIDGLWDPEGYLMKLRANCEPSHGCYVVAEKILTGKEKLPKDWQLDGTVGYDFLNLLNSLFVKTTQKKAVYDIYTAFTGMDVKIKDLVYLCKRLVLDVSLSSELHMLARRLDRIAEGHRSSIDFTAESLKTALSEVIACFPVYRTYIRENGQITEEDRQYINHSLAAAKKRNPAIDPSIYVFIESVLLLNHPEGLDEKLKAERIDFVLRFQQLTGPVMAKGVEDTAFYRKFPLISLNEVGNDPYSFGITLEGFHKKNIERLENWPHSMLASSTHDTKRSEDVRARINILSEIPEEWAQALQVWSKLNSQYKLQDEDETIPDNNDEYLLYQTLLGSWPLAIPGQEAFNNYVSRVKAYMEKAIKEAKIHSSWINPNKTYDQGVLQFIDNILKPGSPFIQQFEPFYHKISRLGMLNSLSQALLKLTSPGVPDIYQGTELWDFSLVDPDNRRPVDYDLRKRMLSEADAENSLKNALMQPENGMLKLLLISSVLKLRKKHSELFAAGNYIPLEVAGPLADNVIAFARTYQNNAIIVIAGRFFTEFMADFDKYQDHEKWQQTQIDLPESLQKTSFCNVLSGEYANLEKSRLTCANLGSVLPLAILESR